jgi:hypothetical protein
MITLPLTSRENPFGLLRRMKQPRPAEAEHCELCQAVIPDVHRHLFKISNRQILCACDPCSLRFQGVVGGSFKLIPRDPRFLVDFQMSDAEWDNLALPINLTFIYRDGATHKVIAMYPSPAGATESLLPIRSWESLIAANSALADMEPDVESLLINRVGVNREHFVAPIDVCYELVGLIRTHWRGLAGGEKVWAEVENFFAKLRERAEVFDAKQEPLHA